MSGQLLRTPPGTGKSACGEPCVDWQRYSGDETARIRRQKDRRVRNILRCNNRDREEVLRGEHSGKVLEELTELFVHHHGCVHPGGVNGVAADSVCSERRRIDTHEADHAMLGRGIADEAG